MKLSDLVDYCNRPAAHQTIVWANVDTRIAPQYWANNTIVFNTGPQTTAQVTAGTYANLTRSTEPMWLTTPATPASSRSWLDILRDLFHGQR